MIPKNIIWSICVCLLVLPGCKTMCGTGTISQDSRTINRPPEPDEILATDLSFNANSGEVRYTLPQPALVRIRVGLKNAGPLLRHLLDWEFREAGAHVDVWNKRDPGGLVDFGDRNDYIMVLNARAVNASPAAIKGPTVTVSFPGASATTPDGLPIVHGIVPFRVVLAEKDAKRLAESKFEVALYVDYLFLMEDEAGTNPFNYRLDVSQYNEGEHMITVNVISYDGLVGTATAKFVIKNPQKGA